MEIYKYYYGKRRFPDRYKLFLDPLQPGDKFGLRFWKDETQRPGEIEYNLRITQGLDERNIVQKYIHQYVNLLSATSLYLQEGEVDGFAGHVLQISIHSNESSTTQMTRMRHVYFSRSVDNSVAIKCTVQNGMKIIELIVNDRNVGIYQCIGNDLSTYAVINHTSASANALISRLSGPQSLQQLCREKILRSVDKRLLQILEYDIATRLPIPKLLQTYMKQGVDDALNRNNLTYLEWILGRTYVSTCKIRENEDGIYGPTTGQYGVFPF